MTLRLATPVDRSCGIPGGKNEGAGSLWLLMILSSYPERLRERLLPRGGSSALTSVSNLVLCKYEPRIRLLGRSKKKKKKKKKLFGAE